MTAFILTYNPAKWTWGSDKQEIIAATGRGVDVPGGWSTGARSGGITAGDRAYLLQQGSGVRGLLGSGWFTGEVYADEHYLDPSRGANYAPLDFDHLLPEDDILPREDLVAALGDVPWLRPQSSGVAVPDDREAELEDLWQAHLSALGRATAAGIPLTQDERGLAYGPLRRRQGQPDFRRRLMDAYGGACAVTGCTQAEALQAAHISPYMGAHTNTTSNGMLLRADIHNLFDAGLLAVAGDGSVIVSPAVGDPAYRALHGQRIAQPHRVRDRPDTALLARHREASGLA